MAIPRIVGFSDSLLSSQYNPTTVQQKPVIYRELYHGMTQEYAREPPVSYRTIEYDKSVPKPVALHRERPYSPDYVRQNWEENKTIFEKKYTPEVACHRTEERFLHMEDRSVAPVVVPFVARQSTPPTNRYQPEYVREPPPRERTEWKPATPRAPASPQIPYIQPVIVPSLTREPKYVPQYRGEVIREKEVIGPPMKPPSRQSQRSRVSHSKTLEEDSYAHPHFIEAKMQSPVSSVHQRKRSLESWNPVIVTAPTPLIKEPPFEQQHAHYVRRRSPKTPDDQYPYRRPPTEEPRQTSYAYYTSSPIPFLPRREHSGDEFSPDSDGRYKRPSPIFPPLVATEKPVTEAKYLGTPQNSAPQSFYSKVPLLPLGPDFNDGRPGYTRVDDYERPVYRNGLPSYHAVGTILRSMNNYYGYGE